MRCRLATMKPLGEVETKTTVEGLRSPNMAPLHGLNSVAPLEAVDFDVIVVGEHVFGVIKVIGFGPVCLRCL